MTDILSGAKTKPDPPLKVAAVAINTNGGIPLIVARAFTQALTEARSTHLNNGTDLLPKPTSHKQAMIHKYKDGCIYAEEEYRAHNDNGT
ncbi:hypothetical protein EJ02DRAFT_426085 [Clathrospora elynae]|uniref:Uncharacterized protein n=1 Tax=Clathrospora elynae TaxID=706981 RepID=A0A6A5S6L6_9PLEO|nr:hypothetical protein EJ02DRAFT_428715 [Clathrospora elynae]KAF1938035.1 hypothetical protein EJ02DRAFT_426085 [Clathrospora elynae]